ncbi:MAG: ImmA/IrrE family metallo-endopeptidase [Bacteroidota bacterium]
MILTSSQKAANKLLESIGWSKPGDLTLNEIALASNAFVKHADLRGSQGRILINNNDAIITIDSKIKHESQRNFVLAHEIGHLVLHKDISELFSDTHKTLNEWFSKGKHENEANQFAAELLMPSHLFKTIVKGQELNLNLIRKTANYFGTSQTATLLKYREIGDYAISVIYLEGGVVRWKNESEDFPLKYLPIGSISQEGSVAHDFFEGNGLEDEPVLVDAIDWFPEDFEIDNYLDMQLFEHNFPIGSNGLMCCLWTP